MFLVVVVCRREESTTQSLKIELLFWIIGPIKTKREEERANGISSFKGGALSGLSLSSTKKGKKKKIWSQVCIEKGPLTKKKSLSFSLCLVVFKNECFLLGKKRKELLKHGVYTLLEYYALLFWTFINSRRRCGRRRRRGRGAPSLRL